MATGHAFQARTNCTIATIAKTVAASPAYLLAGMAKPQALEYARKRRREQRPAANSTGRRREAILPSIDSASIPSLGETR
jgi:hypothetical protein